MPGRKIECCGIFKLPFGPETKKNNWTLRDRKSPPLRAETAGMRNTHQTILGYESTEADSPEALMHEVAWFAGYRPAQSRYGIAIRDRIINER